MAITLATYVISVTKYPEKKNSLWVPSIMAGQAQCRNMRKLDELHPQVGAKTGILVCLSLPPLYSTGNPKSTIVLPTCRVGLSSSVRPL